MLQISFAIRFIIIFNIIFFIFLNDVLSQSVKLEVHVNDGKDPLMGASILINDKQIGNSNSLGKFVGSMSLGDTLMIQHPFYELYVKILSDTSKQNILLTSKVFQLKDVNIYYDKRNAIDSLLRTTFSKLMFHAASRQAFLRQSITENNKKVVLLNEGLLTFKCPSMNELLVPSEGYKKIYMNVESSCNLISRAENKLIYKSNPQIKLRRGYIPDYFYQEIITHIDKESIRSDSSNTVISITGHLPKFKIKTTYIYTIDSKTKNLKQIQYYEEEENKKDLFYATYSYSDNEFVSVYSTAKQTRLGIHYSTNDELILGKSIDKITSNGNYKANKGGLENYSKGNGWCSLLNDYKEANSIPAQRYF